MKKQVRLLSQEHNVHQTMPLMVWADVDIGIAPLVSRLNRIKGVRTYASCQGTRGEKGDSVSPGGKTFMRKGRRAYVMVGWADSKALRAIRKLCTVRFRGPGWGYAYPR